MGDFTNPSFYVLGLIPLASSLFVTLFGQRIASVITLGTVFVSAASATISAALNDGTDEFTPSKFIGICSGLFAGGTALKVAAGNVKFAYGVQGASIGAVASRVSVNLWRPRLLWLIPELEPYLGWVDMSAGVAFGAGAAWISNAYRNIISIFATAAMGTVCPNVSSVWCSRNGQLTIEKSGGIRVRTILAGCWCCCPDLTWEAQ